LSQLLVHNELVTEDPHQTPREPLHIGIQDHLNTTDTSTRLRPTHMENITTVGASHLQEHHDMLFFENQVTWPGLSQVFPDINEPILALNGVRARSFEHFGRGVRECHTSITVDPIDEVTAVHATLLASGTTYVATLDGFATLLRQTFAA
jgi:hypothetical protein